jgi:hypothetical protein
LLSSHEFTAGRLINATFRYNRTRSVPRRSTCCGSIGRNRSAQRTYDCTKFATIAGSARLPSMCNLRDGHRATHLLVVTAPAIGFRTPRIFDLSDTSPDHEREHAGGADVGLKKRNAGKRTKGMIRTRPDEATADASMPSSIHPLFCSPRNSIRPLFPSGALHRTRAGLTLPRSCAARVRREDG